MNFHIQTVQGDITEVALQFPLYSKGHCGCAG